MLHSSATFCPEFRQSSSANHFTPNFNPTNMLARPRCHICDKANNRHTFVRTRFPLAFQPSDPSSLHLDTLQRVLSTFIRGARLEKSCPDMLGPRLGTKTKICASILIPHLLETMAPCYATDAVFNISVSYRTPLDQPGCVENQLT